jgi:hypothetical protein
LTTNLKEEEREVVHRRDVRINLTNLEIGTGQKGLNLAADDDDLTGQLKINGTRPFYLRSCIFKVYKIIWQSE